MKKHIFFSKQGLFSRFVCLLIQCVVILPITFVISFIASSIIISNYDFDSNLVLIIVILILNIIWIIRNSLVKLTENEIIMHDWIGAKRVIELSNISSMKIINSLELRKLCLNSSGNDPLITNCLSICIPIGNVIRLENRFGRDVIIGVWNSNKLYELVKEKNIKSVESRQSFDIKSEKEASVFLNSKKVSNYFLKLPLSSYIAAYFKHFLETVLYPLFITAFAWWALNILDIKINSWFYILMFILGSLIAYLKIIRVTVNADTRTIKLNYFMKTDKNVVKYGTMSNLHYAASIDDVELLKQDSSKFIIATPYSKDSVHNIVAFDIDNNISVALSVSKPEEFYNLLDATNENQDIL